MGGRVRVGGSVGGSGSVGVGVGVGVSERVGVRGEIALDAVVLVIAKAALSVWIWHLGFSHVSDDDYARVVIAEQFAHAPQLDPSGTSWLPLPFWVNGAAMMVFGRSIETARGVALVLGAVSVAAPYVALRAVGVARGVAVAGVVVAMTVPWNAWLGAATVPEASTAALIAVGAIAMGSARASVHVWGAGALAVAALSRYEAWPVCAVMAVVAGAGAVGAWRRVGVGVGDGGGGDGRAQSDGDARVGVGAREARCEIVAALIAVSAPIAWMAWNAHAHGDAFHFLARVAAFRQASGAAAVPLAEKLLGYPRAIVDAMAGLLPLAVVGVVALGDGDVRRRWRAPLAAMAAMLAFLIYGDVRDGAPTHHAERAVVALCWVIAAFGADGARSIARRFAWRRPKREMFVVGAIAAFAVGWMGAVLEAWREYPARGEEERRELQVARGRELRARGVVVMVTPCAFEHFALIAAFGAPENTRVVAASRRAVTAECPAAE